MIKVILAGVLLFFFLNLPLFAQQTYPGKKTVALLPIRQTVSNEEYSRLSDFIYDKLRSNLSLADSIEPVFPDKADTAVYINGLQFERLMAKLESENKAEACIFGEYFVNDSDLHINILVYDILSSQIKNAFIEILPITGNLLQDIQRMADDIVKTVNEKPRQLPHEQVYESLEDKELKEHFLKEDRFARAVFVPHHEIAFSPGTGLEFGRTIYSLQDSVSAAPAINMEYTYIFNQIAHFRIGATYLPFNIFEPDHPLAEMTLEALIGLHFPYRTSFHIDTGIAVIIDYNSYSGYSGTGDINYSVSVPLQFGFAHYFTSAFFIDFRFKFYGFNSTLFAGFSSSNTVIYTVIGSYSMYFGLVL
ncbi:MAG: hypothetical protein JW904_12820 [Spirochaetales bacterium]|nr:hypothetical protein [Spirochaetales bacterium]